jgi:hypothetical protein
MTLLEVMVAFVILGLVIAGYLRLLQGGQALIFASRGWAGVVAAAQDGMERAKLAPDSVGSQPDEALPGGLRRRTTVEPWQPGLALVTVTVAMPGQGRFSVSRLERVFRPDTARAGARRSTF